MAAVSKDKLRKEITAILKNADLSKTTSKKVRQELEEKLEVDLTEQKKVVDDLVLEFLDKKTGKKSKKTDSDEDDDDDDEEENGGGEDENDDDVDEEVDRDKRKAQKRTVTKNNKGSDSEDATDDDDEEEYGPKKKSKTTAKKGAAKKKKKGSDNDSDEEWGKSKKKSGGGGGRRGGGGGAKSGYTKPCNLSPELAKLVGKDSMPRHEVVKKIWSIIKERDLYDPENKQYAICDNDLLKVIGVKRFRAFSMMKYLKNHFVS